MEPKFGIVYCKSPLVLYKKFTFHKILHKIWGCSHMLSVKIGVYKPHLPLVSLNQKLAVTIARTMSESPLKLVTASLD